jgi:hypothetical protein
MNIEEILKKHIDEEGKFDHKAAAKELKEEQGKAYVPKDEFNTKNNELKTANEKIQTLESESQTLEELQTEVEKYKLKDLKNNVAIQAGIPLDLADRLSGETEEEIKADAEKLSGFVNKPQTLPLKPTEPENIDMEEQAYSSMLENLKGE